MSWHFTNEKIAARIAEVGSARARHRRPLDNWTVIRSDREHGIAEGREGSETVSPGGTYMAVTETVTLRRSVTVPEEFAGMRVFLALEFAGAETLVYVDGAPVQAIDKAHHDLLLDGAATGGRTYDVALAAYTGMADAQERGGWSGAGQAAIYDGRVQVRLQTAELQVWDTDAVALYYDMRTAYEAALTLDTNARQYAIIIAALDQAVDLLDWSRGVGDEFYHSAHAAREYLQENLYRKYHADPDFAPTVWATGHAHIDTAWLWPVAHTRQKVARTCANALALMEQYPDYHFSCSQPQQYAYLKQDYPELYARVQQAVRDGRWETVGGMWVESDCNVVSGESLVRHFLYGLRFFQREFGTHTDVVWLPDVFGYSAAFPQIIRKSGMKYFMTIKIYWNQINKPPYQTFEWEGLDGTTVLTHFSPLGDYNAMMTPEQIQRNWSAYNQKNLTSSDLYIYGFGDGGGGPTRQMLETAARMKDFPGLPRVKLSTSEEFFTDLERQVAGNRELPRWVGELYLEYHRGTYTSQGRNKKLNRQSEVLLQTAEQVSCLAGGLAGASYPANEINRAWELTLLNQFHDIIPGSSIHQVYVDSTRDYEEIHGLAQSAVESGLGTVAAGIAEGAGDVLVYNPLSWARSDVTELPRALKLPGQHVVSMDGAETTLVQLSDLPPLGYDCLQSESLPLAGGGPGEDAPSVTTQRMENRFFVVTFDENFEIVSLLDKRAGREVIDAGAYCRGNALLSFEDKPMKYDAWDVDIFYQDKMTPVQSAAEARVTEAGPIRSSIEIVRKWGRGSTIRQRISLYRDLPRIDFATEVDWRERQTLLKAAFPVTVRSPRATYDIQFGNVERPTHWNTSWDWARFEVCGHKWADLSEGDWGVSLLSESKYGWDIKANVMRLSLLKGAISPDPDADLGIHRFTYSLYPHAGDWRAGETVRRGYELNVPVQAARVTGRGALPASISLASADAPNLVLETIKRPEDGDGLIVRLYEAYGQRGRAALRFALPIDSAVEVNLVEEETAETKAAALDVDGARLGFTYTPYEIKTLLVRLRRAGDAPGTISTWNT